jgi:polyribonucleotide nucleotidyltransferase
MVRYLPEIIGKGGCNIRAIQDFTGVKLVIPPVARNETEPVKITVAGPKDKVQQAKDLINEITRVYCTSVTHPGSTHLEMDVPTQMYNYIIGSRGSEIKHIQGNFKVSVHIPNGDSVNKNVVIVGSLAGVQGAQKYIQKIIDQANADRAAAEDVNQAWETAVDEPHEEWMDEYTHPSSRRNQEEGEVLDTAAVAAAAWGAKVLSSAEGW